MLLVLAIILAYILFRNPFIQSYISHLGALSYLGIFIAGILFAFGFTAPFIFKVKNALNQPKSALKKGYANIEHHCIASAKPVPFCLSL